MKKALFFILFAIAVQATYGQDWPAPNSEWSYCIDGFGGPYGSKIYINSRDSTINDTIYAMVRPKYDDYSNLPYSDQEALDNDRMTFLRQSNDTIFRRVGEADYIFFVNGLNVGDTFTTYRSIFGTTNLFWCTPELQLEVSEVTTFSIEGQEYRRVTMEDVNFYELLGMDPVEPVLYHYIEDIGLANNFPYFHYLAYSYGGECDISTDGPDGEFLFGYQNDDQNLELFDCVPSGVSDYEAIHFSISPNPANSFVHIGGLDDNSIRFEVFDIAGKRVDVGHLNTNLIDVSKLLPGLYLLVLISNNGEKGLQKFVVK